MAWLKTTRDFTIVYVVFAYFDIAEIYIFDLSDTNGGLYGSSW